MSNVIAVIAIGVFILIFDETGDIFGAFLSCLIRIKKRIFERSENSDYDLIKDWPIEYDPNPDPGEKPKEGQ